MKSQSHGCDVTIAASLQDITSRGFLSPRCRCRKQVTTLQLFQSNPSLQGLKRPKKAVIVTTAQASSLTATQISAGENMGPQLFPDSSTGKLYSSAIFNLKEGFCQSENKYNKTENGLIKETENTLPCNLFLLFQCALNFIQAVGISQMCMCSLYFKLFGAYPDISNTNPGRTAL